MTAENPAKWTPGLLDMAAVLITAHLAWPDSRTPLLVDPMAGSGLSHTMRDRLPVDTLCFDLEYGWTPKTAHPVLFGDARSIPLPCRSVDVVLTSPTFANGMGQAKPYANNSRDGNRHTYADNLGRPLSEGNTGSTRWTRKYRIMQAAIWTEIYRVLRTGGLLVYDQRDPPRAQPVSGFHVETLLGLGFRPLNFVAVNTHGMTHGQHRTRRLGDGHVMVAMCKAPVTFAR